MNIRYAPPVKGIIASLGSLFGGSDESEGKENKIITTDENGDLLIITGDTTGYFIRYTFTEKKRSLMTPLFYTFTI